MITSPIWYGDGGFVVRITSLFHFSCMCLIWFDIDIFSWIFVMKMLLSLQAVTTWNLLHFPGRFWLDTTSRTCFTVVSYFMTTPRIQKVVLFLYGNTCVHGLLFVDWYIYDILWCSQYFTTIPIGLTLGGKLTLTSNISYLTNG